ncbi:MAG: branched-chain amino acid ABC transporter permease [Desulfurococcales archaeon]|jgi:branched-chain amino acid transport system permease protein|nr:branched-chain amino acid ABC transporter permease [Desulfurococcales archaeon]
MMFPINQELLLFNIVSGIMLGTLYGLATMGLSLIFGVIKVVNVSHGALIMLGAYTAYWLYTLYLIPPFISLGTAFLIGLALGFSIFHGIIKNVLGKPEMISLVATFGLAILFEETAKFLWGPDFRGYTWEIGRIEFMSFTIPLTRILASVSSLIIAISIYIFLYKTKMGMAIRGVTQEPEGAALCGINVIGIYSISVTLAIALTVASGVLITLFVPAGIEPYMGGPYTLRAFVIAVLGGLASPIGAFVAGLIFGLAETLSYGFLSLLPISSAFAMTRFVAFSLLLILLLIRPEGLFRR